MATIPDPAVTDWVPIWNPLTQGPTGPQGPQGPQGPAGTIPPNTAFIDVDNHFTVGQHISGDVTITSNFYEKGRTTPLGHWIDFAPVVTTNSGTVTVTNNITTRYTLIGNTMIINFYWGISLSATPTVVNLNLPGGFASQGHSVGIFMDNLGKTGFLYSPFTSAVLGMYRDSIGSSAWPTGVTSIGGSIPIQIG